MMSRKWLCRIFCGGCLVLLVGILGICLFRPCQLEVTVLKSRLHTGQDLEERDFQVVRKSLFGITRPFVSFTVENLSDKKCRIRSGTLETCVEVKKQPVESVVAEYIGKIHEGDALNKDSIVVTVHYADGYSCPVDSYEIQDEESYYIEKSDIIIKTAYGDAVMTVDPIPLSAFWAYHAGSHTEADVFDMHQVKAEVLFEDGMSKDATGISSRYVGVYGKDDIVISSPVYGDTILKLAPDGVLSYIPTYEGRIYEGQMLKKDLFHVVASKEDGKREDVLDFEMKEHRIWKAELIEGSSKMYGSVCVPVTPVFIRSVEGSFSYRKDKIKADSISFIYTDGVRFDLPLDEVEILSDDQTELSSGNTVRISWQDHEFVVTI